MLGRQASGVHDPSRMPWAVRQSALMAGERSCSAGRMMYDLAGPVAGETRIGVVVATCHGGHGEGGGPRGEHDVAHGGAPSTGTGGPTWFRPHPGAGTGRRRVRTWPYGRSTSAGLQRDLARLGINAATSGLTPRSPQ